MAEDCPYFAVAYVKQKAFGCIPVFFEPNQQEKHFFDWPSSTALTGVLWNEYQNVFSQGEHQQLKEA